MKKLFIRNLWKLKGKRGPVELLGWAARVHRLGKIIFFDIEDSTGSLQAVLNGRNHSNSEWEKINKILKVESAIKVAGKLKRTERRIELQAETLEIIGENKINLSPSPRSNLNIFSPSLSNHILKNKHLYIRNKKFVYLLKTRHKLTSFLRKWFDSKGFTEIAAPILTPITLYERKSALKVPLKNQGIFLTQCVGFYLEAAAHSLERVYNIGPSFRAEETRSPRHLMEYWHLKSEIAFCNLEEMMTFVERLIKDLCIYAQKYELENKTFLGKKLCLDGMKTPYPRISYTEAVAYLNKNGIDIKFGKSLNQECETKLSKKFKSIPFWIVGLPKKTEPFPYSPSLNDTRTVQTADLIASRGYGEILGTAEKISDPRILRRRMKEKHKLNDNLYRWVIDTHLSGAVPHAAMGMGVERLIRWVLGIPHIKEIVPFPRMFGRKIYP
ncbi:MAG: amino acid--tRNA ligase-related protein [Patescibacteria group bacterium]